MVDKNLKYKLAVLGCASSCLMNVAYAQTQSGDEEVIFSVIPYIGNVACGAQERSFIFQVENTSARESIEIEDYFIEINEDEDAFPFDDYVVTVESSDVNGCEFEQEMEPGDTCNLTVTVWPNNLPCPDDAPMEDEPIVRSLVLHLDAGSQYDLVAPIDFDVTVLGTAQEYAIFADDITLDVEVMSTMRTGDVQVSQDVGCLDVGPCKNGDLDDIWFHDGAELILGLTTYDYTLGQYIDLKNVAALYDALAAYETFLNAAADVDASTMYPFPYDCDAGNPIYNAYNLGGGIGYTNEFTGGVYCLFPGAALSTNATDLINIVGNITFTGDENTLFVIVMNSAIEGNTNDVEMTITPDADYDFEGNVSSENIYWVGADQYYLCENAEFVGTILTKGNFDAVDDCGIASLMKDPTTLAIPGTIEGRVIGLSDGDDEYYTEFSFVGNTISQPGSGD